jgi:SHNi-TPR
MAAPDAKTSPSSKEVQSSVEGAAAVPKETAANGAESEGQATNTTAPIRPVAPTYEASQASEQYLLAKSLLGAGDFEQALELIEVAIEEHKAVLASLEVEAVDLHECMAPWHYLYGTTLLYQIEESTDTQMTMGDTADADGADADAEADPSPAVEDMEIAWENLDTARTITETLLTSTTQNDDRRSRWELDLAQILLREADLQRWNGRYADAIPDYTHCLELRQRHLPPLDRQLADVQYNLGLSHLSQSTELQTNHEQLTPDILRQAQEHCQQGVGWYLECARTLCGQIAHLCGVGDTVIFNSTAMSGGLKTTGLEDPHLATAEASATLQTWRDNVARLEIRECGHLVELLDEIQETVRESEESQRAVRQTAEMKWNAQKAVVESEDGSTTQIGFGGSSMAASVSEVQPVLVKKKKKRSAEESETNEVDAKKLKTDE